MHRLMTTAIATILVAQTAMAAVTMSDVDVTNDHFATYEEMRNAIPGLDKRAFDKIDLNSDGRISAEEIGKLEAQSELAQHKMVGAKERPLMLLDQDGDGFMSLADIQRVHPDFTDVAFRGIDTNSDNRLSYQEFYTPEAQTAFALCGPTDFSDLASIDTNNDKFADFAEIQAAFPKVGETDFRDIDLNSDGRISAMEWLSPEAQCIVDEHGY